MRQTKLAGAAIVLLFLMNACKKEEGSGGNSTIQGLVHLTVINPFDNTDTIASIAGADEDVFIVYGDEISVGDRTRSGHDGRFEFKFLRKGSYKIYVYSEDNEPMGVYNPDTTIIKSVEITEKKQTVDAGTFYINKYR